MELNCKVFEKFCDNKKDLVPLKDLSEAINYASHLVTTSHYEAIGFLLGLKLLAEASGQMLHFRLPEDRLDDDDDDDDDDDIEAWLADLAGHFDLAAAWQRLAKPDQRALQQIVLAWQPYRFLPEAGRKGIFSPLAALLCASTRSHFCFGERLTRFIQTLAADNRETTCLIGADATSLLDIPLMTTKKTDVIGACQPLVGQLAQRLFEKFACIPEDFLKLPRTKAWSHIICTPPFGPKIKDGKILARFELADRGQGRRSRMADPQHLWLEQCYHLLAESGSLLILLAEGFLSNASARFAREWVQKHFMIEAIFSLPPAIFPASANIKTSLICLRKLTPPPEQYQIFMAELAAEDLADPAAVIAAYHAAKSPEVEAV